jgi:hypothetical protein
VNPKCWPHEVQEDAWGKESLPVANASNRLAAICRCHWFKLRFEALSEVLLPARRGLLMEV